MTSSIEPLAVSVDDAQKALRAADIEGSSENIGALLLAVLALHAGVARMLATLPDVVGDDVPWSSIGDRDLWASAVTGALTLQRGRIAALAELDDRDGLLAHCRLSLQTLAAIVRDIEGMYPVPQARIGPPAVARPPARLRGGPAGTTGPLPRISPTRPGAAPAV